MLTDTREAPSILDLIARNWTVDGPVSDIVFSRSENSVAFVGQGRLSIAPLSDPERPETRIRTASDTGRQTILPREKPVRALTEVSGTTGPVVPLGEVSFLTGGRTGGVLSVTPRGQKTPHPALLHEPLGALACCRTSGRIAIASGDRVTSPMADLLDEPDWIEFGEAITSLEFSPDGTRLAVGHTAGVSFLERGGIVGGVALDTPPSLLSFSLDGALLACGLEEPGFALIDPKDLSGELVQDYPTEVRSFGWCRASNALATSGAFRTVAWELADSGLGDALEAGRNGLVIVERVAASPDRPIIATGYANGLLCLAKIGRGDEIVLRNSGAPISALAWSSDGAHLAFGDTDGTASLISFPSNFFK